MMIMAQPEIPFCKTPSRSLLPLTMIVNPFKNGSHDFGPDVA
jgi:hypothetical protein